MQQRYLIALGSNVRHHRHGSPENVLRAAFRALAEEGFVLEACSPIIRTEPLGPSRRCYANAAALIRADLTPPQLLTRLHGIERNFGRRRTGQSWRARVLDLDIILWSGGAWSSPDLTIPHPPVRDRTFVLRPATAIAPRWRDPLTNLTLRHLLTRLTRPHPPPR